MFDRAIIQDKSRELLAVENLTLESDAMAVIKLCKELLLITRGLKETWCLGSIRVKSEEAEEANEEEVKEVFEKFNQLTEKISSLGRILA